MQNIGLASSGVFFAPRQASAAYQWPAFAARFDQYKVNGLKLTWCFPPKSVVSGSGGLAYSTYPTVCYMAYDNDSPVVTIPAILGNAGVRYAEPVGLFGYSAPSLPQAIMYDSALITSTAAGSSEWCNTSNPTTVAGGISTIIDQIIGSTSTVNVSVIQEWDVTFHMRT